MFMKPWRSNKFLQLGRLGLALVCLGTLVAAGSSESMGGSEGLEFFKNSQLDFWKPSSEVKDQPRGRLAQPSASTPQPSAFPWKAYLDPKNEEFFREGDYLPPAPFMEVARQPTPENLKNWFQYIDARHELLSRLQTKLNEYAEQRSPGGWASGELGKVGGSSAEALAQTLSAKAAALGAQLPAKSELDPHDYFLRLYFDSHCPHCQKMIATAQALSERGFFLEYRQLDFDSQHPTALPVVATAASAQELKQYGIQAVPVLLVGHLKQQRFFKIAGYQTESSVLTAMIQQSSPKPIGDPSP